MANSECAVGETSVYTPRHKPHTLRVRSIVQVYDVGFAASCADGDHFLQQVHQDSGQGHES